MPLSPDDLALWKRRIHTDIAAQSDYHDRWRRSIRLFNTTYWDDLKAANPELVEVNYSTTFITTLVSAIFARMPKWKIEAKRPGRFYQFAATMHILLDQFKEESKLKDLAIRCVVDAATCNIGWVELGFFPSVEHPIPTPETGADENGLQRRLARLFQSLSGSAPEPEPSEQGELHQQKRPGSFYLIRRSPWDVIKPEGFFEYERLPYLIVRERPTWKDFTRNPRYTNQDRVGAISLPRQMRKLNQVRTSPYTSESVYNPQSPATLTTRDPARTIELFTVWDRREDQVFTLSETSDKPHEEPQDWPYLSEGFPQKPLQFNYVPELPDEQDNFYGFSDLEPIEAQVLEKSGLRTQQSSIRKRAIVKVFVQSGTPTETQLAKLQSPDIEIIPVQNINAIQVSPPIAIPAAVLQMEDIIDKDLSRDSGLPLLLADASQLAEIQRATVANLASQSTTLKTSYKVDRIEAWVREIGLYQIGLFWQYLSRDEVGERLGRLPTGEEWIPLPENLLLAKQWVRNELFLTVEAGSTKPLSVDVLERDAFMNSLAIIQQVAPDIFAQTKRQMLSVLIKKFNEPALEAIIMAAMDSQEQQTALQENQLLMAGMPQVVSPHDDHQTHELVHAQAEQTPVVTAHRKAHLIRVQESLDVQRSTGQGVRQKVAAPSAAEIGQGGATRGMDLQGVSQRVGRGSRPNEG